MSDSWGALKTTQAALVISVPMSSWDGVSVVMYGELQQHTHHGSH